MKVIYCAAVIACCIYLGACAGATGPGAGSFSLISPHEGRGVIYVARPYGWNSSMLPVAIELNGKHLADLGLSSYTRIEVTPGPHSVSAHDGYWTKVTFGIPHPAKFNVEAGKAYYLLPKRWVENIRPNVTVIGSTVVTGKTGDTHATFSVDVRAAIAEPPEEFKRLGFTEPKLTL